MSLQYPERFKNPSKYVSLLMGWMGCDGKVYEKCPSFFFILGSHIEIVHIYVYTHVKIVTEILMDFKIR